MSLYQYIRRWRKLGILFLICICLLRYLLYVLLNNWDAYKRNDANVQVELKNNFINTNTQNTITVSQVNLKVQGKFIANSNQIIDNALNKSFNGCSNVHIFYYPWYRDVKLDHKYFHWNHKYLPHWRHNNGNNIYPTGSHIPPDDIASNYYPQLGPYSSGDPAVILNHMQQIASAGVGVLSVSYYPPGLSDDNGKDWQFLFPILLITANKFKLKVAFHIEPYKERSALSVKRDLQHIISTYGKYDAFYKFTFNGKTLPLIYIYDSYHIKSKEWNTILGEKVNESIRETWYDAFMIGLVVERKHMQDMVRSHFDGFYTYFGTDGFSFGSTRQNWNYLNTFASNHKLIYIPSIGPGYVDTRIRPWNKENTRNRANGKYYKESWKQALLVQPSLISITSFNEWHEGTQIEKAVRKKINSYTYLDYFPNSPDFYLMLTKDFVTKFERC